MPTGAVAGERQTFNAQEQDHDTKLFDLSDRKLDAMIGGFPSPDRLWEKFRSLSPYVYCANNPLGMTDPGGMQGRAVSRNKDLDNTAGAGSGGSPLDQLGPINLETPIGAGYSPGSRGGGGAGGGIGGGGIGATFARWLFLRAGAAAGGTGSLGVAASNPTLRQKAADFLRTLAPRADVLAKIDPNKLNHIFGKAEHNLAGLLERFGSRESAFYAIQQATQAVVSKQGLQGVFQTTITLGSETIAVRGNVVNGVVKIGTAFKP